MNTAIDTVATQDTGAASPQAPSIAQAFAVAIEKEGACFKWAEKGHWKGECPKCVWGGGLHHK